MNKKPWLAVILNVLLTGLGYIYVGKRKLFGIMLLVGELAAFAWALSEQELSNALSADPWLTATAILWTVAFAIDVYHDAKAAHAPVAPAPPPPG